MSIRMRIRIKMKQNMENSDRGKVDFQGPESNKLRRRRRDFSSNRESGELPPILRVK